MILKYIVCWAFGGAFLQALIEYKEATPGVCFGDDCTLINVAYSTALTLLSALVVFILQPLSQEIEFGDGKIVDWIEDFLEDTFDMTVRASPHARSLPPSLAPARLRTSLTWPPSRTRGPLIRYAASP